MSELIDLVNSSGEVVKRAIPRMNATLHGDLFMQIVIAVITNSSGQVLVHERSKTKSVNGGDIDHVCGGILSGETPEAAARREATEEVGVSPVNLSIVREGINIYGRYCYLLSGFSDATPIIDPSMDEVAWANFMSVEDLRSKNVTGGLTFVDGFFEDLDTVLSTNV